MKVVNKPVDVLVYYEVGARPKPFRIRLIDREGNEQVVKITKVAHMETHSTGGGRQYRYQCQGFFKGIERIFELRYYTGDSRWEIAKI